MFSSNSKFYLVKRQNGYYYISIVFRDEINKRRYKYISTHTKLKSDANKFLSNLKAERTKQSSISNQIYKLSDIKPQILQYIKINRSEGTYNKYDITLRYLIDILGDKYVTLINYADIELLKSELLKRGIKETTINSYIRTAKALFNHSLKLGIINDNKIKYIKQFNTPETKILSFSASELKLIENCADKEFKNMIRFSYLTGVRISELLNLQYKDIENGAINILNKVSFTTKSKKNRSIPINKDIKELLEDMLDVSEAKILPLFKSDVYIFTNNGIRLDRKNVSNKFKCIIRKLKLNQDYHWHCLRATFIMNLVRRNINPILIKELAGHSSLSVTEKYCKIQMADLKIAMED